MYDIFLRLIKRQMVYRVIQLTSPHSHPLLLSFSRN